MQKICLHLQIPVFEAWLSGERLYQGQIYASFKFDLLFFGGVAC